MKRVLVAGVVGGLLLLGYPTLASSAQRHDFVAADKDGGRQGNDAHHSDSGGHHSDSGAHHGDNARRGDNDRRGDRDRGDHGRRGYYDGYPYGYGYGYGYPYYGYYDECHRDPSGSVTCEPYGGDYDPYGYNGGYSDPPPDPYYCSRPHSAHSAQCPDDRSANNGVPPGTVVIRGHAFNPPRIDARAGEQVTWTFDDKGVAHTVTADNGSFDSGKRMSGEYVLMFKQPGSYSYHCAIHPEMKGVVVVGR